MTFKGLLGGVLMLACAAPAAAATLYVNNSGSPACSDATTRANNSESTPWCTIGRAAWGSPSRNSPNASQAAQAGDTVEVSPGTYSFGGSLLNRWQVVYNPVNQGAGVASQIRFRAMGTVNLTAPFTRSPVIGCYGRSHVVWEGPFTLDEANISISADTGTVVLVDATGCGVDGVSIDGDGAPKGDDNPPFYVDNHTGVRVEMCQSCFVRNSTITAVRNTADNHNGSAVMLYNSDNTLIENNLIYSVDNAVFIKGVFGVSSPQQGTIVRRNLMSGCDECVTVSDSQDSRIYQNVIRDAETGLNLLSREPGAYYHPVGDWFVNNTIRNMSLACIQVNGTADHTNVRVWNNILSNCNYANYRGATTFSSNSAVVDWEHNNYFAFARHAEDAAALYSTFTQWTTAYGHDRSAPESITSDPRFANAAAGDYRLCTAAGAPDANCTGASPARTIGVDILDLDADGSTADLVPAGAYVTNLEVIGPVEAAPIVPTPPTNLRILSSGS